MQLSRLWLGPSTACSTASGTYHTHGGGPPRPVGAGWGHRAPTNAKNIDYSLRPRTEYVATNEGHVYIFTRVFAQTTCIDFFVWVEGCVHEAKHPRQHLLSSTVQRAILARLEGRRKIYHAAISTDLLHGSDTKLRPLCFLILAWKESAATCCTPRKPDLVFGAS